MTLPAGDFHEIAHCGGRVTITVTTAVAGNRQYQLAWRHQSANAAALFAIYALPPGIPVETIKMGGIGQPWNAAPLPDCIPVFIGSDSTGLFGHQCPACSQYWRSSGASLCPYCGQGPFRSHELLAKSQRKYVQEYCNAFEKALGGPDGEYVIDMDAVADAVGDSEKPAFFYSEQSQQHLYTCRICHTQNDILGRFGYCAWCGTRNDLQELEQSISETRTRINAGDPCESCVRDIVSLFDSFSRRLAKQLLELVPMTARRQGLVRGMGYHALAPVVTMFKEVFDIDVFARVPKDDQDFAILMFHRRHVYEHLGGEADEKYIAESGDKAVRPKQALREDKVSAHRIASTILQMAKNLHSGFHELLPVDPQKVPKGSASGEARVE